MGRGRPRDPAHPGPRPGVSRATVSNAYDHPDQLWAAVDAWVVRSLPRDEPAIAAISAHRRPLVVIDQPRVPGAPPVGVDDPPRPARRPPPLTTVAQPLRERGRVAGALVRAAPGGAAIVEPPLLPTSLVVRESTAPPAVRRRR